MYYRLNCVLESGESRGYQWRELSQQEFVAVATGTRPVGDTESQARDSTDTDPTFTNSTVYYGAVWHNGWVTRLDTSAAEAL